MLTKIAGETFCTLDDFEEAIENTSHPCDCMEKPPIGGEHKEMEPSNLKHVLVGEGQITTIDLTYQPVNFSSQSLDGRQEQSIGGDVHNFRNPL